MEKDWLGKEFRRNPPAAFEDIQSLESLLGRRLPSDYVDLLKLTDGGEGFVPSERYVVLWPVGRLLELNDDYEIGRHCFGVLLIGSNGSGEGIAIDFLSPRQPIAYVPLLGAEREQVVRVCDDLETFLLDKSVGWGSRFG